MRTFFLFCLSLPIYFVSGLILHSCFELDFSSPSPVLLPTVIGFVGGCLFFVFISKFIPVYVFGHELAHWIFAKIFLKETGKFKVGKEGGAVEVKDPNLWVSLAPYFYPTFTVIWIPFWFLFKYLDEKYPYCLTVYFVILSLSWAYHVTMTLYALKFEQSDLQRYGKPLSLSVIIFVNLCIIFSFLALFSTGIWKGLAVLSATFADDCRKIFELIREISIYFQ